MTTFDLLLRWARGESRETAWGYLLRDRQTSDHLLEPWQAQYVENVIMARIHGVSA